MTKEQEKMVTLFDYSPLEHIIYWLKEDFDIDATYEYPHFGKVVAGEFTFDFGFAKKDGFGVDVWWDSTNSEAHMYTKYPEVVEASRMCAAWLAGVVTAVHLTTGQ